MNKNQHAKSITVKIESAGNMSMDVSFTTAVEMLHVLGMSKWESTAPMPGKSGMHGDNYLENSQQARLQFLLTGIGIVDTEKTYSTLALKTRNHRTMDSKITTHKPVNGLTLVGCWYLDACLNLGQKQEITEALRELGYSRDFVDIANRFVAGEPISGTTQH
jgi:hypothetical protein